MLVIEAMEQAQALTGQVVAQSVLLRWLSELDGQLAIEFYGAGEWAPYTTDDLQSALAVPYPWDGGVYVHHLEAMTYFSNGEYARYENARAMSEEKLGEFRRYVQRMKTACGRITVPLAGEGGTGVTVIGGGEQLWTYLSAYGTAVRHGFEGTPEEWLASLVGEGGMSASVYDPDGDVADAGGIPAYLYAAIAGSVKAGTVSLSADWTGEEAPYTQTVTVTGAAVTAASKIDLQPTAAQLAALADADVTALVIENDDGVLTAYALGAAPEEAMTMQCTVTEVEA